MRRGRYPGRKPARGHVEKIWFVDHAIVGSHGRTLRCFPEPMEIEMPDPTPQTSQEAHLAQLIVKTLNLDTKAEEIDPQMPLFSEGLGLDSIDILEIALAVSQTYGVQLRSDDENNATIFRSLRSLSDDIQRRRSA